MESRLPRVMTWLCLVPLAGFLIAMGLAAYSSFLHGHWPVYSRPDPKRLPHQWLVLPLSLFSILSFMLAWVVPAALGTAHGILHWKKLAHDRLLRAWALYLAGAAAWSMDYLAKRSNSGSLLSWLLD